MQRVIVVSSALLAASVAPAHPVAQSASSEVASIPIAARPAEAVVDAFHGALERGDMQAALALLADDAVISEEGDAEHGKPAYAAEHLGADIAFLKEVHQQVLKRVGYAAGSLAWVSSEGRMTGSYRGKAVDRRSTETMVLRRSGTHWKIVHIHWSSAAAK